MATAKKKVKKSYSLSDSPTEPFRMRFSKKYADVLVMKIQEKADDEDRSFPSAIERVLVEHYGLK